MKRKELIYKVANLTPVALMVNKWLRPEAEMLMPEVDLVKKLTATPCQDLVIGRLWIKVTE